MTIEFVVFRQKKKEYSSIVSTAIMNGPYYAKLESNMKKLNS